MGYPSSFLINNYKKQLVSILTKCRRHHLFAVGNGHRQPHSGGMHHTRQSFLSSRRAALTTFLRQYVSICLFFILEFPVSKVLYSHQPTMRWLYYCRYLVFIRQSRHFLLASQRHHLNLIREFRTEFASRPFQFPSHFFFFTA